MAVTIPIGKEFSPQTTLTVACDTTTDNSCTVDAIASFDDPSGGVGVVVFATDAYKSTDPADYEVLTYTGISSNDLTGLTHRAGTQKEWAIGTYVSAMFTHYSWEQVKDAIEELYDADNIVYSGTSSGLEATDVQAAIDEVDSDLDTHIGNSTDAHGIDDYLPLAGGTMTGDINCNGNEIQKPQLEAYTETIVSSIHSAAGDLTLDLATGNHFKVTVSANITGVNLSNAASADTNSFTLELMLTGDYSVTWLDTVSVISAQDTISASDTDNSFNDSASGFSDVEPGDLINVSGFTEAANNDTFRVVSATTSKIVVCDSTEGGADLTTEAAGDSVTITRDALYGDTPTLPDIYQTLVVELWSSDGDRFKIAEVGSF